MNLSQYHRRRIGSEIGKILRKKYPDLRLSKRDREITRTLKGKKKKIIIKEVVYPVEFQSLAVDATLAYLQENLIDSKQ